MKKSLLHLVASLLFVCFASVPVLASTLTVDTEQDIVDPANCSLRAAIQTVNSGAQVGACVPSDGSVPDTITLPAGNYTLSGDGTQEDLCADGDLDINANLTLNGAGSGVTTVSGPGNSERIFHIGAAVQGIHVSLNGLTVTQGFDVIGGGVLINNDVVEVTNPGFADITSVTFNDVGLTKNTALAGSGICSINARLSLFNSQVNANEEATQGGGLFLSDGETTIQNSTISDNKASVIAGGIFFQGEGRLQIDSSTISNNTSILAGGGLTLGFVSEVLISNSTISGNEAVGGIIEAGAPEGSLGYGGGIYRTGTGPVILVNSTVSGNTALTDGGGIFIEINSEEPLGPLDPNLNQFYNVTLAKNTATQGKGGGIAVSMTNFPQDLGASTESFAGFTNTLIADNSAGTEAPDCFGILTSQGYNLVSNIEGCTGFNQAGDQPGVPALIGPLANNGGPTQTHALQSGSTAIDRGNPEGCIDSNGAVLMRDQRNFTRPVNATGQASAICDIGAFEVGLGDSNSTLKVTKTDDVEGSVSVGDSFSYTITVTNLSSEPAMDVQLNDPLPSEVTFKGPISSSQGTCSNSGNVVNCDLGDIAANATVTIQFAVIASSPNNGVVNTVTVRALTNATTTTQTATVTTQVIEGDLQGSGCILNAANYAPGSLIGMFLPLGLGLSFIVRRRVK